MAVTGPGIVVGVRCRVGRWTAHLRGCLAALRSGGAALLLVMAMLCGVMQRVSTPALPDDRLKRRPERWLEEGGASALYMFQMCAVHVPNP